MFRLILSENHLHSLHKNIKKLRPCIRPVPVCNCCQAECHCVSNLKVASGYTHVEIYQELTLLIDSLRPCGSIALIAALVACGASGGRNLVNHIFQFLRVCGGFQGLAPSSIWAPVNINVLLQENRGQLSHWKGSISLKRK